MTYVATGVGKYSVGTSLTDWTTVDVPDAPTFYDVVRGGDRFVLLGGYKTVVLVDNEPPQVVASSEQYPFKGCFSNGYFWRVTNKSNLIQKSVDGITWTNVSVPCDTATLSIASSGLLIMVTGNIGYSCRSLDGGDTWTANAVFDGYALWLSGCNNGRIFAAAGYGWIASADMPATVLTRTITPAPVNRAGRAMPFFGSVGVIGEVSGGAGYMYTLDNGNNWQSVSNSTAMGLCGATHDDNQFVLIGNGKLATLSNDGQTMSVVHTLSYDANVIAFASNAVSSAVRVYYANTWKTPTARKAALGALHSLI
jgi:hypothetical protein